MTREKEMEDNMQKIFGKYEVDQNFVTIYNDNTMYVIAKNTGDWGCVAVGERTAMGQILTQEVYDSRAGECTKEGTFELS